MHDGYCAGDFLETVNMKLLGFTLSQLFSVVTFVLSLGFVLSIVRVRRPAGTNLAWILLIVIFPYVGILFYLILGPRKIPTQLAKKDWLFESKPKLVSTDTLTGLQRILSLAGMP